MGQGGEGWLFFSSLYTKTCTRTRSAETADATYGRLPRIRAGRRRAQACDAVRRMYKIEKSVFDHLIEIRSTQPRRRQDSTKDHRSRPRAATAGAPVERPRCGIGSPAYHGICASRSRLGRRQRRRVRRTAPRTPHYTNTRSTQYRTGLPCKLLGAASSTRPAPAPQGALSSESHISPVDPLTCWAAGTPAAFAG
jgi:hypothetical protein